METKKCNLQMKDIYFSKIECLQIKNQNDLGPINLKISYDIDTILDENDKYSVEKRLSVNISDEKKKIEIEIVANGLFKLECDDTADTDLVDHMLNINTIAIMLPYLRSEVSLISAQPGLMPIMLPVANVIDLVADIDKKKQQKN